MYARGRLNYKIAILTTQFNSRGALKKGTSTHLERLHECELRLEICNLNMELIATSIFLN